MSSLISLTNVEYQYPSAPHRTLKNLNLEITKGESIFLFGASGSGKTTLLEILAGVLLPTEGSVSMLGKKLDQVTGAARDQFRADHIGYIFQSFNLIPYLTVEENISMGLAFSPFRKSKVSDPKQKTLELSQSLGISEWLKKNVTELSVGQQQRVAVARALIGEPEIILADEPTSALDQDHREKFIELLFAVAKKSQSTVVFVSHDRTLEPLFSRSLSLLTLQGVRP